MKKLILQLFLFAAIASLASCVAWTPRSIRSSPDAVIIDKMPMQTWGIESCGAGALSTVLQHYGDPLTMANWEERLPKTRGGVMSIDLLIAARARGFDAQLVTGDRKLVQDELAAGRPIILMLKVVDAPGRGYDFWHYVVLDGIDAPKNTVRVQFGDGKARWTTVERLETSWKGGGNAAIVIRPRTGLPLQARLRDAVALEEKGSPSDALAAYRAITTEYPDSVVAWTNAGNAASRLGMREDAEKSYRQAIAVDPHSRDALNNLAWLLYEAKRFDEAENFAREAVLSPGPDDDVVLDTLGRIQAARGECSDAVATFRKALERAPESRAANREELVRLIADNESRCRS